jgi:transcriptional regulator GlxA family with amidase domain
MECAQRLLFTTDLSIAEIAAHCGYLSAAAFTTAFVRAHGAPPTHYRGRSRHFSL